MKTTLSIILALAVSISVSNTSCKKDAKNAVPPMAMPTNDPYTTADMTIAYDNFNRFLFDTTAKLYYKNTNKTGLGAIWTQAVYWDMAMNAYKRTNDVKYKKLIEDIFQGGYNEYDRYNWNNGKEWFIYDDIMWWVISLARAYEITGDTKYLTLSESGFQRVWSGSTVVGDKGSYDPVTGGMYWQWDQKNPPVRPDEARMACINYPTVIAAMTLYNITKKADYLTKATGVYTWARNNLFDPAIGKVADSKHGNNSPAWQMHTYNQATCIGAAMMLYKQTNDAKYLNDAVIAANFVKYNMCNMNEILPYEGGEEQGVYNAILAQYIIRLITDGNKPEYLTWIRKNINQAWVRREVSTTLTGKDYNSSPVFPLSCYDACGIPALMQVISPAGQ